MTAPTALPVAYALRDPGAVCRGCNTALERHPEHPGQELGDWYRHPEPRLQFGHTSAFMRARPVAPGLFDLDTLETR